MLMEKARQEIADFGRKMSTDGLSEGTSGNLSVYDPESGYMAIGPSGLDYFNTNAEDIVVMTLDGKIAEGKRKPSSEYDLHATVYKLKPDARAVVHTHSTYCTTFACLRQPLRAIHYVISGAGVDEIPCAEYATFGTSELAQNVGKAMGESKAILLANHGLVTSGFNMTEAFRLAVNLEFAAEIQWRTMCVGQPVCLTAEDMAAVRERAKTYGQATKEEKREGMGY